MVDYPSKLHTGAQHMKVRPWYLHMKNSHRTLPRASRPSLQRGCVEIPGRDPYKGRNPLHMIPIRGQITVPQAGSGWINWCKYPPEISKFAGAWVGISDTLIYHRHAAANISY